MKIYSIICVVLFSACSSPENQQSTTLQSSSSRPAKEAKKQSYAGSFTNGMKQTFITFDVSADGKKLENLTFKGYWRCSGKLTQDILGPEKSFAIINNKVDGVIVEPEGGGATAIRYDLQATINGNKAEGTFRMNINALACDTYKLNWTAEKK